VTSARSSAGAEEADHGLLDLLANVTLPFELRTVDGSPNNLVPTQSEFGAADNTFPRLADPTFQQADPVTIDPDGHGEQAAGDRQTRRFMMVREFVRIIWGLRTNGVSGAKVVAREDSLEKR